MSELIEVHPEFLHRMLGVGADGGAVYRADDGEDDARRVQVVPGGVPEDFPATLPPTPGLHVWGGFRGAAGRWTFANLSNGESAGPEPLHHWCVSVDVPRPQPDVMVEWQAAFEAQGWRSVALTPDVFVPADRTQWMAVHARRPQQLTLFTRAAADSAASSTGNPAGDRTQVWLTVRDLEAVHAAHLLGQDAAGPPRPEFYRAPMPTLTVPAGWAVQRVGGSGGSEHSEGAALIPPAGTVPDEVALLTHFAGQLRRQGWETLETSPPLPPVHLLARTREGYGLLTLSRNGSTVLARVLHVALEQHSEADGR